MLSPRKTRTRDAILDAAYSLIARMGIRKTTFEEVASKAGVSRQTLYRYFDDKEDLVAAVMDREADRFLDALRRLVPEGSTLDEALAGGLAFTFDYLTTHPLLSWVHEHEPDALVLHVRSHWGPILAAVKRYLEPFLAVEVARGALAPERADIAGDWATRIALSYLILPGEGVDLRDPGPIVGLVPELIMRGLRG